MKLQLINAPLAEQYRGISRTGVFPPLNLITLATYVNSKLPETEIEILDGDIITLDEILNSIDADIVGISPKILTYDNSLKIAEKVKQLNSKVVFGGPHASTLYSNILKNRPYVDYVVIGDGEQALVNLLNQISLDKINNLAYRSGKVICKNQINYINLNSTPFQNNQLINLQPYFDNLRNRFQNHAIKKGISVHSQKGCVWQNDHGGCIFCRQFDSNLRFRSPRNLWKEIEQLCDSLDIDYIWNVSDTITGSKNWLREFYLTKPQRINPKLLVYSRSDEIDDEVADFLKNINCYEVLIGVESGNNERLKFTNKGFTKEDSLRAINLLTQRGIYTYPSFVLGLPGETENSVNDTIEFSQQLLNKAKIYQLACSTLVPLPDSFVFKKMMKINRLREKYINIDNFDVEELRKDWVYHFCDVEYDFLTESLELILQSIEVASSFGLLQEV